jgi:hypothetical protein
MNSIVLTGPKEKLQLLEKVAKQMGVSSSFVDEDLAFGLLADKVKTGKTVSKSTVLKKLNRVAGQSICH